MTSLLVIIGAIVSTGEHFMNLGIDGLWKSRYELLGFLLPAGSTAMESWERVTEANWGLALLVSLAFTVGISLAGVLTCSLLDPTRDSAGSGLPLLKYILSGEVMEEAEEHLRTRTLVAKALGLMLAAGAGLSIGREGPNVHMAAIISWLLMKSIGWYHEAKPSHASAHEPQIFRFPSLRRQILDAASNYWKSFMAAVAGYAMTRSRKASKPPGGGLNAASLPLYILVGVVMGLLGPAYTKVKAFFWRRFMPLNTHRVHRYYLAAGVSLLSALLFFTPGPFFRLSIGNTTARLLSSRVGRGREGGSVGEGGGGGLGDWTPKGGHRSFRSPPTPDLPPADGNGANEASLLFLLVLIRTVTSILDTNLQLPAGDFMCLFLVGAALGRLFGHGFQAIFPALEFRVASFALCGAAALAGASTHTISSGVIALELTGEYHQQLPIFLSVLAAYTMSRGLSQSIYDALILKRFSRLLPSIRNDLYYKLSAEDVMEEQLYIVPLLTTYGKLVELVREHPYRGYPVVTPRQVSLSPSTSPPSSPLSLPVQSFFRLPAPSSPCLPFSLMVVPSFPSPPSSHPSSSYLHPSTLLPSQELLGLVKRRTLLLHLTRVFRSQGLMLELTRLMPLDVQL
ncbi:hypothetical protein NSK_000778, partial [Nannochloropsis salina CCMP1776]